MTTTEPDHRAPAVNARDIKRAIDVLRPDYEYASKAGDVGEQVMIRGDHVAVLAGLLPADSPITTEIEAAAEISRKRDSGWLVLQTPTLKTLIDNATKHLEQNQ